MSTAILPKELSAVEVAFPANVNHLLPAWESIPSEFKRFGANQWTRLAAQWFFSGLPKETVAELKPRDGIDKAKALRHVQACLGSFKPKHEHKEAGCAYLLSLWFEPLEK